MASNFQNTVIVDSAGNSPTVDSETTVRSLLTISNLQAHSHTGNRYSMQDLAPVLGTGGSFQHLIVTGTSTSDYHFSTFADSLDGRFGVTFHSSVTITTTGTAATTIFNRDLTSANVANILIYLSSTIATTGSQIWADRGGTNRNGGLGAIETGEFQLKPSTNYLVKYSVVDISATVSYKYDWYEHA